MSHPPPLGSSTTGRSVLSFTERHSSIDGLPIASFAVDKMFRQSLLVLLVIGLLSLPLVAIHSFQSASRWIFVLQSVVLLMSVGAALAFQRQSVKRSSQLASFGVLASVALSFQGGPLSSSWQFLTIVPMLMLGLQYGRRGVVLSALVVIFASVFWTLRNGSVDGGPKTGSAWLLGLQLFSRCVVLAMGGMVVDRLLAIVRERETFLIDVFRDIDIGVSVFDVDDGDELRVAALNPRIYQLLGLPKGPLLGKRSREVLPTDYLQATDETLSKALAIGETQHHEARWRSGDHPQRLLITAVPQRGDEQRVRRLVVSGTDISQLKEAERKLQFQAELLANVADAVVAVNPELRISYTNRAAERLFKVESKEILGKALEELTGPGFLREFERHVGQAQSVQNGSYVIGDNQELPLEFTISTQKDEDGQIAQYLIVIRDIRDRRSLEAHLLRAQKTEALGRLAGGIAHDFNNMLVVITGNAELLAESLAEDHPGQEDLKEIKHAATRAADLVRQLLTFSRRQQGTLRTSDLNQLLRDMNQILLRLLGKGVQLSMELCDELWSVMVDVGQLEQVMMQLLLNARDAIPKEGRVVISTTNVTLGDSALKLGLTEGDYVEIRVKDTGIGMSPETMKRLFEPFFSTKSTNRSVGLGLSVCYGIIRQNRGAISADSKPGEGTTFTVWLPRSTTNQETANAPIAGAVMAEFHQSELPSSLSSTDDLPRSASNPK